MADTRTHSVLSPPINTIGEFTCYAPFELVPGVTYRCSAVRTFAELEKRGTNVYTTFYQPKNIDTETYQIDSNLKASIVTLTSGAGEEIYVPDTYIQSYPGDSGVIYSNKVIVVKLGMMPDTVDTTYLVEAITDAVRRYVGVESIPEVATIPVIDAMTNAKHVQLEATRRSAIVNYVGYEEQITKLTNTNESLLEQNEKLLAIIEAHPELFNR